MGANDVRLTYVADVGKALANMGSVKTATTAQIKETARATAALSAYDRAQAAVSGTAAKAVVPALHATAAAGSKTTQVAGSLAQQLPDVWTQMAAGTSASTVLTQQGLQVVQVHMQSLIGVGAKLGLSLASLGPIALGVAAVAVPLGVAFAVVSQDVKEMEAQIAKASTTIAKMGGAQMALKANLIDVDRELQRALNTYDEEGAAQATRDEAIKKNADETRKQADAMVENAKAAKAAAVGVDELMSANHGLAAAEKARATIVDGANRREAEALEKSAQVTEVIKAEAEATEFLRKKAEALATAKRGAAEATRQQIEAEARMAAMVAEAGQKADAQVEEVHKIADAKRKAAEESADITAKAYKDAKKEREQAAKDAEALASLQASAINSLFGTAAEGAAFLAAEVAERGIGSGKALFGVSKGIAIAQASINAYQAATLALATIPPPVGALVGAASLASGLLQVGKIAATEPQFHRGRAYDEMPATILRDERVLTATGARTMGGDKAVAAANRGQSPGGTVTAAFVLGHRVYDQQTRTALKVPGSSLAAALTKGRHVGHR